MRFSQTRHHTDSLSADSQQKFDDDALSADKCKEFQQYFSSAGGGCCLGIDEAGRGPVLGPMVYGIAFCPLSHVNDLKAVGFDDSKKLTEEQRDQLFDTIRSDCPWIGWSVTILSPRDISCAMLRRNKYNLNSLSHDTAIGLIRGALDRGVDLREVYVDTVGPPEKYEAKLQALFPTIKFAVRKKADSLFPIVSAASICAKVTRDQVLRDWQFDEPGLELRNRDFGSGYPGDPATKQWLRENLDSVFGFPSFIRFSWSTCKLLLENEGVGVYWPSEEDAEEDGENEASQVGQKRQLTLADFGVKRTGPAAPAAPDSWLTAAGCRTVCEFV